MPSVCAKTYISSTSCWSLGAGGEARTDDRVGDRLQRDRADQLHLTVEAGRLHHVHPELDEACFPQQRRETGTNVRVAAVGLHDTRV